MTKITNEIFRQQIKEDIEMIQEKVSWQSSIEKDEYAFNYWILSKIYNLDEEDSCDYITDYNDKGVDCFVHYKEDKTLFIIQNKYYNESTNLNSKEVSDFLTRPLSVLDAGKYKRSDNLQNIYNDAVNDPDYKIYLHFYVTKNNLSDDIKAIVDNHNNKHTTIANVFNLDNIKQMYYKEGYEEKKHLNFRLSLLFDSSALKILPKEYGLPNMNRAFYVMANVYEIYGLWKEAEQEGYPLFEKNIREYLGTVGIGGVNKKIIDTLKSSERHNFFYYNNGITMICKQANLGKSSPYSSGTKSVELTDPQIVNGCQTVSSIAEVLKNPNVNYDDYKHVYVMVKILVIEDGEDNKLFYRDVVKYTNNQNAINEQIFGAGHDPFYTIRDGMKDLGFLLYVKQSDRHQSKLTYKNSKEKGKLLEQANKTANGFNDNKYTAIRDVHINLAHLIQIIAAFVIDAQVAFTKKSDLLKPSNKKFYQGFSLKINEKFTFKQMVKLIILYKKAEYDKKRSEDKRTPISYYFFNFLGYYLKQRGINQDRFLEKIKMSDLRIVYEQFKNLSSKYQKAHKHKDDYTIMIKDDVDESIMQTVLYNHFESLKEYAPDDYLKLEKIFSALEKSSS